MEAKGPKSTGLMQRPGSVRYFANNGTDAEFHRSGQKWTICRRYADGATV